MAKNHLRLVGADSYIGEDGCTVRREYGDTPNGNPLAGRWALRSADGVFVDFDQYRNDLAEHHGLVFPCESIIVSA